MLQLSQLGCMTLMPVDQLLPSQVAELLEEAGLPYTDASFLRLDTLLVGDMTTDALQVC